MANLQSDFFLWNNDVLAVAQKDVAGNTRSLLYLDNENNTIVGPADDDPQMMGVMTMGPLNIYKRHEYDDFLGDKPQLGWTFTGSGGHAMTVDSQIMIYSSSAPQQMELPNTSYVLGQGTSARFYMSADATGYQQTVIGVHVPNVLKWCQFRLTEAAGRDTWVAECADGSDATVVNTGVLNDNGRHMFLIDMRATDHVDFWISDDSLGGAMIKKASIATHLPPVNQEMIPFGRIGPAYGGTAERRASFDLFYGIRNR